MSVIEMCSFCPVLGAIYGATDWINIRSLTKKTYMSEERVPDWVNLLYNVEVPGTKRSL